MKHSKPYCSKDFYLTSELTLIEQPFIIMPSEFLETFHMLSKSFFQTPPKKYAFSLREGSIGIMQSIKSPEHINQEESKTVLINSFIGEYKKYLSPSDIKRSLQTWDDVRAYYDKYFHDEFRDFSEGRLHYWIQVSVDGKIAGWATFEREPKNPKEVYMNLLVVDPKYQQKGIGGQLVNALINLDEISDLNAVHLLLRKKNQGGRIFYSKLGFNADPEYQRADNFVDLNLLEGWTWKNPALQHREESALTC